MKEKMMYIVNDGREFDSKEECERYEKEMDNTMDNIMDNTMNYIKFYDMHAKEIKLEPLDKRSFTQYCKYHQTEHYNYLRIFLEDVYYIHISKNIPTKEEERQVEDFIFQICNDIILDITQFNFKKGITYFYDEEIECFTNTVYESEKIMAQMNFLESLENLE